MSRTSAGAPCSRRSSRPAALAAIHPAAAAAEVDHAARDVLMERGFGKEFTHGVGRSVGILAISMEYLPRLHLCSPDHLEAGMTFNIEPATYIQGYGGIRHCDVVAMREESAEVLTPFQARREELNLPAGAG
jgi:Xaa-Pro aminopeptidase